MDKVLVFTGAWYPWYAAKALESEDFADLSLTEEGAYRRALDIAWRKGSLPANPAKFAAVVGKRCTEKIAVKVLQLFTPMQGHPGRVVNKTLERIRKEQEEKHRKRVGAGLKGGRLKGNKNQGDESIAKALLNQSLSNTPTDLKEDKEEDSFSYEKEREREKEAASPPPPTHTAERGGASESLKQEEWQIVCYHEFFPEAISPSPLLHDLILQRVSDHTRWRLALNYWRSNNYRPASIGKMLDFYDELGQNNAKKYKANTGKRNDEQSTDEFLTSIGANPLQM